jgi:LemA protein
MYKVKQGMISNMDITLLVILGLLALVVVFFWMTYNGLVTLKVRVEEAWSDITVQLKRRADLIPNLVETVKGYATHEKEVFERVTEARTAVMDATAKGPKATAAAENQFEGALKSLFAVAEAYPQLRATENFQQLNNELVDTEDKIQAARRFYNGGVRDLNTKIQQFPSNLIAGMFGFVKREFFEVEDAAAIAEPVQVKF